MAVADPAWVSEHGAVCGDRKAIEKQRNTKRRSLFEAEDEIDERRQKLIDDVQAKLEQGSHSQEAFTIRWVLS